jgi:multicomponent Na+:H+ antiporter subunit E
MVLGVVVLWLVWLAMAGSLSVPSILAGLACAILTAILWRVMMPGGPALARSLLHPVPFVRFFLTLALRFVISSLRTSWLILRGGEEGRMMALPIRITDPLARFLLLNSITLTPSTISLLIEDDLLYIHWLQPANGQGDWRAIKESLEDRLTQLFERGEHGDR